MSRSVLLLLLPLAACDAGDAGGATMSFQARAASPLRAVQTPSAFAAAVVKAEMLRGADDADPGMIFDAAAGDVPYALVDLGDAGQEVWSGVVGADALGTYTHARITVAAVGQVISYVDAGGVARDQNYVELYQDVDNADGGEEALPIGLLERGDVVLSVDGSGLEWFQIDASMVFASSPTREDVAAYQDPDPGEAVQVIELAEPITVDAGGDYALEATFDLTDTFSYVDLDGDGAFEPLSDDHDGTVNGFSFHVLVPGLSAALR